MNDCTHEWEPEGSLPHLDWGKGIVELPVKCAKCGIDGRMIYEESYVKILD